MFPHIAHSTVQAQHFLSSSSRGISFEKKEEKKKTQTTTLLLKMILGGALDHVISHDG